MLPGQGRGQGPDQLGNMSNHQMLRRLLRQIEPLPEPAHLSPARVLALAMARAADRGLGLSLTVLGVEDACCGLDGIVDGLGGDLLRLGLTRRGDNAGVLALDPQLRAAVVEMVTLGRLRPTVAADRPSSPGDIALCVPFAERVLGEVTRASDGNSLSGWTDEAEVAGPLPDARTVGLMFRERTYRLVRFRLDLGVADRKGSLILILPAEQEPGDGILPDPEPDAGTGFNERFREALLEAPAMLQAVLHRLPMPLREAENLKVGQTIPLPGVTTRSVRLEGPDGAMLAPARLGQVTGLRAVRVEWVPPLEMTDTRFAQVASLPDSLAAPDMPDPLPGAMSGQAVDIDMAGPDIGDDTSWQGDDPGVAIAALDDLPSAFDTAEEGDWPRIDMATLADIPGDDDPAGPP